MKNGTLAMPKITGVECPVMKPIGVSGDAEGSRIGIGCHDFPEGPGILVTISAEDGTRLVALMSPAKAKHVAGLLNSAVKNGLRKLGKPVQ